MEPLQRYFDAVWAVDFEFYAPPGERPTPHCLVARDLLSGRYIRYWLGPEAPQPSPLPIPFDVSPKSLFVAYYASAELGCFLALNWEFPCRILDLYAEFRCLTSGRPVPCGHGLLGALECYGLDSLDSIEKQSMRDLAMRGGPYTEQERQDLIEYCQTDVDALARLLPKMLPHIDWPRALLRGRYMAAAACIEWTGIPIDVATLARLRENWSSIRSRSISKIDQDYGVYLPTGQRVLDPDTQLGAAILATAAQWQINPYDLAVAVRHIWQEEQILYIDSTRAQRAARRSTGLTHGNIHHWEHTGQDYATWPGRDETAQELTDVIPELGIRPSDPDRMTSDGPDYAGRRWRLLQDSEDRKPARHDARILHRAAELVASSQPGSWRYSGELSFSKKCFKAFLTYRGIPWPHLPSGELALDDETFRAMAKMYPGTIGPLRDLRHTMGQLRITDLAVGSDGRNRCMLSAFGARSGRNATSTTKYIFGASSWLRSLIKPGPGRALAYVDWSQQELGIAAALSQDPVMMDAYQSGDFYLNFAKMAKVVPESATKQTHGEVREVFKTISLAVLFGQSEYGLAKWIEGSLSEARELLHHHKKVFRQFWRWSDQVESVGLSGHPLSTQFGWRLHLGPKVTARSFRNFPMQGNGAEMMRLACCLATERGIQVCGVIHDALLIESSDTDIDEAVVRTQLAMQEASELVLPGFPLRTEVNIIRYPDRYIDPRGQRMWETVTELLDHNSFDLDFDRGERSI